jgi:hypothetical protein
MPVCPSLSSILNITSCILIKFSIGGSTCVLRVVRMNLTLDYADLIQAKITRKLKFSVSSLEAEHAVAYSVEALCYKPEGHGFEFR